MTTLAAAWTRARPVSRLRAWTGLILMAYATCHLANHAVGIVSFDLMARVHGVLAVIWHEGPGEFVLMASLGLHILLALIVVARSISLRWPRWQWLQLGLGLAASIVLAQHVAGTAQLEGVTGARVDYAFVLQAVWPENAINYTFMLTALWAHGCIGLHYWWRIHRWYARAQPALLVVALLLPALALGGMAGAGRDIAQRAPEARDAWAANGNWPSRDEVIAIIDGGQQAMLLIIFGGLALALALRGGRYWLSNRRTVPIRYPSGHLVRATLGLTLLEMSREAGIPHAAVCGGRARCSTCRVRITAGAETLPPPSRAERRPLERLGNPEGVRLACQIRPTTALDVVPLVAPPAALNDARAEADPALGREREIAVLFCDLRGFTKLSEAKLPYDVVYILNQYFRAMGEAIEAHGGHLDKVLGDGVMALFGLDQEPPAAARSALDAVAAMSARLDDLNSALAGELDGPLRLAMGLHQGSVVVGVMGHGAARQFTAIGDTVNVASRLEALAKQEDAQLAVSDALMRRAGVEQEAATRSLRGRRETIGVHLYPNARSVLQGVAVSA